LKNNNLLTSANSGFPLDFSLEGVFDMSPSAVSSGLIAIYPGWVIKIQQTGVAID
jgi:hypothetical protein